MKETLNNNDFKKPICKLIGTDGNIFMLIGKASSCLKNNGYNYFY